MIPIPELTANRLKTEICEVLTDHRYRARARLLQKQILSINGSARAADIIENIVAHRFSSAGSPVAVAP
jgi:UDP:flavonoid glycosyltransferase YjiC (YdhE family)